MTLNYAARRSYTVAEGWICSSCRLRTLQQSKVSFSTQTGRSNGEASRYNRQLRPTVKTNNRRSFSTTPSAWADRTREPRLPERPARTRFAPSPTGYLHIGGLRTALFSFLLAKRTGGQFLLRIEDTDQKRFVPDAEAKLLADLQWAGLQWDEGPGVGGPHGPYRQSERTDIYWKYADELLENGSAYRCFCSPQSAGEAQLAFVTSGCYQNCASLSRDESQERAEGRKEAFTVRLHVPLDAHKRVYPDLVYGRIQRLKRSPSAPMSGDGEAGVGSADTILLKSDGTPTYHFANVVDDHLMQITHVIRGVEWSASTPLHYDIYSAFDWTPPQFAHVGLLVDENLAKLSKRNHDQGVDVASIRNIPGVLPEALLNFLALLGWSNPTKNDVMDMQALIRNFDLKFTRGNAMVRLEKLSFLQCKHAAEKCNRAIEQDSSAPIQAIVDEIKQQVLSTYRMKLPLWATSNNDPQRPSQAKLETYITAILLADSTNYSNASQWADRNRYFFSIYPGPGFEKGPYSSTTTAKAAEFRDCAMGLADSLETSNLSLFAPESEDVVPSPMQLRDETARIARSMRELRLAATEGREELAKPLMTFLRKKIAMGFPGPSIDVSMALLGPEECAGRLRVALDEDSDRSARDEAAATSSGDVG